MFKTVYLSVEWNLDMLKYNCENFQKMLMLPLRGGHIGGHLGFLLEKLRFHFGSKAEFFSIPLS